MDKYTSTNTPSTPKNGNMMNPMLPPRIQKSCTKYQVHTQKSCTIYTIPGSLKKGVKLPYHGTCRYLIFRSRI